MQKWTAEEEAALRELVDKFSDASGHVKWQELLLDGQTRGLLASSRTAGSCCQKRNRMNAAAVAAAGAAGGAGSGDDAATNVNRP